MINDLNHVHFPRYLNKNNYRMSGIVLNGWAFSTRLLFPTLKTSLFVRKCLKKTDFRVIYVHESGRMCGGLRSEWLKTESTYVLFGCFIAKRRKLDRRLIGGCKKKKNTRTDDNIVVIDGGEHR